VNTFEQVKKRLSLLLKREDAEIIAIKGQWGVGKTYFWNGFMDTYEAPKHLRSYCYVSLFGLNSISELKRAIFAKQKTLGEKHNRVRKKITNFFSGLFRHVDLGPVSMGAIKNTEIWADVIQDKSLQNFLICIDDLERKECGISPSALLGFVNGLRDERNCKVVLLYNDSKTSKDKKLRECLAEYREKVFDHEIVFQPSVDDCISLIFPSGVQVSSEYGSSCEPPGKFEEDTRSSLEILRSIGLTNIRVA